MLQTRGVDIHVFNAQDHGLPDATGVIYGAADTLDANRPLVVAFLRAAVKGWQWALAHPDETAKLMVDKYGAPGLNLKAQVTEIVASKPYIEAGLGGSQGLLALDVPLFTSMIDTYRKVGMIQGSWTAADFCDPSFIQAAHTRDLGQRPAAGLLRRLRHPAGHAALGGAPLQRRGRRGRRPVAHAAAGQCA